MSDVDPIDIVLEFGLGDNHGKAAFKWMFDKLDLDCQVKVDGSLQSVRSFGTRFLSTRPGRLCCSLPSGSILPTNTLSGEPFEWVPFLSGFALTIVRTNGFLRKRHTLAWEDFYGISGYESLPYRRL